MSKITFTPKSDVGQYLDGALNTDLYQALTSDQRWRNLFEPLDFLNLLYERYSVVENQALSPLDFKRSLLSMGLSNRHCFFLLDALLQLMQRESKMPNYQMLGHTDYQPLDMFTKQRIIGDLRMSTTSSTKLQQQYPLFKILIDEHTRLAEELQIGLTYGTEEGTDGQVEHSLPLRVSEERGAKTNLTRVLNAIYELHIIEDVNGNRLTKKQFFTCVGGAFGAVYSNHSQSTNQSLNPTEEIYLEVFDELKKIARRQWRNHARSNN